ncbi:nicotinamide-nucleotide adenylyltransferase [Methanospirillum hungatei JF-1]|jgi:nicotinamide-nucleotide adenylyltransferase|uniref:Nicotinamide-nucleotide adenylyltransferase n=1 Tax=Methanospirillum hungatei JF-1 (strain ATCC 27890 / DSM 864 / NBRC 100397 / JF-1) TaxID=323259 RepID=NADM_METHJ|nr:nicotinamide-nucleotide adenylyltransferase [Methanospirillum hungatei]Q2FTC2.1 RecName: Full=Nicotinamide-nucleotide adenylyltransferase; AltName: Full=NAD(+) diphosphorylase; AltName: Full=NAD(+) pyrophosphorylase; AltName: Full=NMN adenylyltransferase [Methanospirillum hungatei JF-1]MBP7034348.1 nicotinamide-nucleotide adenylyltransferase [Methanospirillum sp.]ABD42607.1 nicotinamide-nucleotide adenylyltransferase [Methanospirillum hungatei JF-1]MBP9007267.1 nicotinamide-nucleotide adenyl
MIRALYIGRFQPYHNGHHYVINQIAQEADELIIGIGSAQMSHEPADPFTAGERVLMITGALQDLHKPLYVIPLEDINRNVLWVSHVRAMTPPFHRIYSGNPLVIRLFHEAGIEVLSPAMYERATLSGTKIRDLIACDKPWEDFVPPAVVRVIQEIDGISRIRALNQDDGDCPGR